METPNSGYAEPGQHDEAIFRGDAGQREFPGFWVKDCTVPAGMNVNIWDVSDAIRALVSSGRLVGTAMLADVDVPLTEVCLDAAGRGRSFGRRAGLKQRSAV